ncbi:trypsin-like peptidase domain-containing protein [Streptomyces sp. RB6PN25]|uniref:Trypsin-like peptidase domain-containing protein n=1 Tax=Streptomyces humicola TaxID=2953240 RepID=A0ABT1PXM4_9ACTN|nr:trypsin-like peptidase domain-containing protein [Streptomyces humicola]MCQ4082429.1 trypsin-like peptidase domain-containing protein [Streptomyces humicola]
MVEHPWRRRLRLGRVLTRRSCRNTALVLSWLVIVAISSTASAAALTSSSGLGISHTIHDTKPYAMNGAIFRGSVSGGDHFCSAGVVDSEGKDLIVTAAHCVSGGTTGLYFVPGYHDGQAPYGEWSLGRTTTDTRWDSDQDQDLDVAFVSVQPLDGREIQDVVGGYKLGVDQSMTQMVRITGYPGDADAPITCANRTTAYDGHQLRIDCTAYTGGTSGSPWVTGHGEVIGVIGGYQEGGNTPDISYSPYFDEDVQSLYAQAVAAGP